jgi:hypothetical protein
MYLSLCAPRFQGNRIIKRLKEKKKQTIGKSRRRLMDIRANLAIIPDSRINRCKKHLLTDILLLCIIAYEGVSTIKSLKNVFSTGHGSTFGNGPSRVQSSQ